MKIKRDKLESALNIALKVVKNSSLPVISCVLLDKTGLTGTDLETTVFASLPVRDAAFGDPMPKLSAKKVDLVAMATELGLEVVKDAKVGDLKALITTTWAEKHPYKEEKFVLNASRLAKIVGSMDTDEVEITAVDNAVKETLFENGMVKIGENFSIPSFNSSEFPIAIIPEGMDKTVTIKPEHLKFVCLGGTDDDVGFKLNVVNFDSKRAVSTDGHRLHMVPATSDVNILIARDFLKLAKAPKDGVVVLKTDGVNILFQEEGLRLLTKASDAQFPDVEKVTPSAELGQTITVKGSEICKVLGQAKLMLSKNYHGAKFTFNGKISVEVMNPDLGQYQKMDIPIAEGSIDPEVEAGFNVNYLMDAVSKSKENLSIQVNGNQSPAIVRYGDYMALVMPMRI